MYCCSHVLYPLTPVSFFFCPEWQKNALFSTQKQFPWDCERRAEAFLAGPCGGIAQLSHQSLDWLQPKGGKNYCCTFARTQHRAKDGLNIEHWMTKEDYCTWNYSGDFIKISNNMLILQDWQFLLQNCLKMFISSMTAQRGQHTHTHTLGFHILWGHLINNAFASPLP